MAQKPTSLTRRTFLSSTAAATGAAALHGPLIASERAPRPRREGLVAIASANGKAAVETALEQMRSGVAPVDAAVAGVNLVEADPNDMSVGYGGLPNERGVVELDAAVMDGPTHNSGAVASLQNIMMPSKVALTVMRRTDHCLLVGPGALEFARMHGFKEENLLTERARKRWVKWKETLSDRDDYFPPAGDEPESDRETGTIHVSARNADGDLGCVTTTSGLSWKIPGRVGDSPILGAGLYLDNDVGSAGSTGRGESMILSCGSMAVVERMRAGRDPQQACLDVLERIVDQSRKNGNARDGKPTFNVNLYAVAKDGAFGGAGLFAGARFAVADEAGGARIEGGAHLFERS